MSPATYGPRSGGEGYLVAPLKGKYAGLLERIIIQGGNKNVPQNEVQSLVWAVRLEKFDYVLNHPRAKDLLRPEDVVYLKAQIEKKALLGAVSTKIDERLPPEIKQVLELQKKFLDSFDAFSQGKIPFEKLEQHAVLVGDPPFHKDDRNVPAGRWVLVPDGYFVRFGPGTYRAGTVEFFRPEPVVTVYDKLGRPVYVLNRRTKFRIDFEYYGDSVYVPHPQDRSIKAYPFKSVKIFLPAELNGGKEALLVVKNKGFILAGTIGKRAKDLHRDENKPIMLASVSPHGLVVADSKESSRDAGLPAEAAGSAATDAMKEVGEQLATSKELLGHIGEINERVSQAIDIHNAVKEAQKIADPTVGQIDKVRAVLDVPIPGIEHLSIPLAGVKEIISKTCDLWEEVTNELAGGKSGDVSPVTKIPRISKVGLGIPGKKQRQRLGLFKH